jgi:hypothetical protein
LTPIICRYASVGVDAGGKECGVNVVELTTLLFWNVVLLVVLC